MPLNMKGIILKCVNYETPIIPAKQLEEFAIDLQKFCPKQCKEI